VVLAWFMVHRTDGGRLVASRCRCSLFTKPERHCSIRGTPRGWKGESMSGDRVYDLLEGIV